MKRLIGLLVGLLVVALVSSAGCSTKNEQRYLPMDFSGGGVVVLDSHTGRLLVFVPVGGWKELAPPITLGNVSPLR